MKCTSKFPKRKPGWPICSIAMVLRAMLLLLLLALWTSPVLMGSRVHAHAEPQDPNGIVSANARETNADAERTNADARETNADAERTNANERGSNGPRRVASALRKAQSSCDVTFGGLQRPHDRFWCHSSCTAWTPSVYPPPIKVVGTLTYTEDSPVCMSALHAGEIRHGEDTYVTVSKLNVNTSFVATVRNRVVSAEQPVWSGGVAIGYKVTSSSPKAADKTDLTKSELVMIHNNNHQECCYWNSRNNNPLTLACLPNTPGGSPAISLYRWNYEFVLQSGSDGQSPPSVRITVPSTSNNRVLRCLGSSPALDVTGIFGRTNDGNSATLPTVTASIGETATIRFAQAVQNLRRLPENELPVYPSQIGVKPQHAGLYRPAEDPGVYSRLIVRACPAYRYGTSCDSWCPDCMNGGECDAASGRCVCAPGTRGRQCENYCAGDQYGAQCHLNCSRYTLHWDVKGSTSCAGLTFCVRDPKGCSCLPGYKPPNCDIRCGRRNYGPDCGLQCNYCNQGRCDSLTGSCLAGCINPQLCSAAHLPFNLPRLRTPPSVVAGCSNKRCFVSLSTWNMNDHDGEVVPGNSVTGYELQLSDQQPPGWVTVGGPELFWKNENKVDYDFIPGRLYSFRVRVLTSVGTADPVYNLRLRETAVPIPCLKSYAGLELVVKEITQDSFIITGMNDETCWPRLQYHLVVREWSTSRIVQDATRMTSSTTVSGLRPNTTYGVIFDSTTRNVTTLPQRPQRPAGIEIHSISSSTAVAKWLRPEGAERYNTTLQPVQNGGCYFSYEGPKHFFNTTDEQRNLTDLIPYQRYKFCVMAVNDGGQSTSRCEEFVTRALHAPAVTLSHLTCTSHQTYLTCTVYAPDQCEHLNGPEPKIVWELSGGPNCSRSLWKHDVSNVTYTPGTPQKLFYELDSFVRYTVEVYVRNEVGRGHSGLKEAFETASAYMPGPVQQLEVTSTVNSVLLRWSPPCPPLAPVSSYEVAVHKVGYGPSYEDVSLPFCPGQQGHFCYTKFGLTLDTKYRIWVRSCHPRGYRSEVEFTDTVTTESVPGTPVITMAGQVANAISANFAAPPHLGAKASCYLAVINEGKTLANVTHIKGLAASAVFPYTVADLASSLLLLLISRCCNKVGCSATVELPTFTLLAPPEAEAPLRAADITDTNATLLLPEIRAGNANISLVVLVQNITGKTDCEAANFTAYYLIWKQNQRSPGRKRRTATNQHCSDPSPSVYMAGTADKDQQMFVLGSGEENNCHLTAGNSYRVAAVAEAVLLDQVSVNAFQLPDILIAGGDGDSKAGAIWSSIVAIALLLITITLIVKRKQHQRKQPGPEPASGGGENKGVINTLKNQIHWPKRTTSTPDETPLTVTDRPPVTVTATITPLVPEGEAPDPPPRPSPANRGENKGVINTLRDQVNLLGTLHNTLRNQIHWPKRTSSTPDETPLTVTDRPPVTVTGTTPPPVHEGEASDPPPRPSPSNRALLAKAPPIPNQFPKPSLTLIVNPTSGSAYYSKPTAAVRPVRVPKDTIYEDLAEVDPIYGNGTAIPVQEIEAYLNQTINSPGIINDFLLVPKCYPKSMSDAELPRNKSKNRYRNNLPYNDTRVRLSIMNRDPCSDYINASHVQGVTTAKHYIAAQGPKDSDHCTIPDFWRMVVENNVDVIIMVANFVEKNVVKVGKYLSSKRPIAIKALGGSVHVVSQDVTPYCTISVVQVTLVLHGSTETRQVTHYHYTKWPDHGVPKEIHTLAQMLHHIANNHQTMCALVHCSAGIGRTGTVIFDLLCYDHLVATQKLDLITVLVHLRNSRANLVENRMQFKLGLQLLDEILFGFYNVIPTSNLLNSMSQLLADCQTMFSQLNCLPSSLEYKTGTRSENIALNRSPDILPADSRMIFFQNHAGQSPYINAVSLDSHSEVDAYIITEHPLKSTLESFWEMVKQKASPIVVVLNNSIGVEYPQMFSEEVDGQMKFGSTVVTTTNVHRAYSNLIKRDINVETGQSLHSVVLYEVVGWPRGAAAPPDHTVLTCLADVILGGSLKSVNPPVLVCSDGVTACGLMAGVLRVVERVKQCQDVDIYRTAVMLRRCRREFVVDHIQLQVMVRVATDYLDSFQDYDNFK